MSGSKRGPGEKGALAKSILATFFTLEVLDALMCDSYELELELILSQMAQKPMPRG